MLVRHQMCTRRAQTSAKVNPVTIKMTSKI